MAQTAELSERKGWTPSFSSRLGNILKMSTIKLFVALGRGKDMKYQRNIPDTELRLMSVKPGYLMRAIFRLYGMLMKKKYLS